MRKLPNQNAYRVYNPVTGRVYASRTTRSKARSQIRLLWATYRRADRR